MIYNDDDLSAQKYAHIHRERTEKYAKDHKFFEDFAVQNEPYFYLSKFSNSPRS